MCCSPNGTKLQVPWGSQLCGATSGAPLLWLHVQGHRGPSSVPAAWCEHLRDPHPRHMARSWGGGGPQAVRPSRPHCHRRDRRLQAVRGLARVRAFFNAPVVIFHLNILSYFSFLCLFAYVLMVDFQPSPSWCEHLIYLWLFSLVCEELRQVRPTVPAVLGGP